MPMFLQPKRVIETYPIEFNFIGLLPVVDYLASVTAIVSVVSGVDPTPSNLLDGLPAVAPGSKGAIVTVKAGVVGVTYRIEVRGVTTVGADVYEMDAILSIIP